MKRILICMCAVALLLSTLVMPANAEPGDKLFCAVRAIRISPTEVVVEFTMPLNDDGLTKPFVALRRMVMTGDEPTALAWDGSTPLQEPGATAFYSEDDHQRVIVTFPEEKLDEYLTTEGNEYYDMGYRTYLGIEEKSPASGHDHATLHDVVSVDGHQLLSTLPAPGDNWDGVYVPIEEDYNYVPGEIPEVTEEAFTFGTEYEPVTEPEETDPSTKAPTATTPATGEGTGASTEKPEEKGCGGAITFAPAALVAMLGAVLVASKKK